MVYSISRDANGHWIVTSGRNGTPVAVFYAHYVPSHIARRRAEKFVKVMK